MIKQREDKFTFASRRKRVTRRGREKRNLSIPQSQMRQKSLVPPVFVQNGRRCQDGIELLRRSGLFGFFLSAVCTDGGKGNGDAFSPLKEGGDAIDISHIREKVGILYCI